ncbi:MAG: RNA polymerase sigma factor [Tahibacter sp.]
MTPATNPDEFVRLLDAHKGILYKVSNAYCAQRDDRNDLIQEIVMQLWRSFERYDGHARFSTWMHSIAINVAISHYRGENRRIRDTLPIEEFGLDVAAADQLLDAADDDLRSLHQLIAQLDEINRAIILLYLEGHPHDEIAAMVGISNSNVATRINRIKQSLQRQYQSAGATA